MDKDLLTRAHAFADASLKDSWEYTYKVYFTRNPINNDLRYKGRKYFFVYHNTHTICKAFKTQAELHDYLTSYGF